MTTTAAATYTTVYRTGGTANFRWIKCLPVATRNEAETQVAEIQKGGRPAYCRLTSRVESLGVPTTFEAAAFIGPDVDAAWEARGAMALLMLHTPLYAPPGHRAAK